MRPPILIEAVRTVTDLTASRAQHRMAWLLLKGDRGQVCNQTRLLQLRQPQFARADDVGRAAR